MQKQPVRKIQSGFSTLEILLAFAIAFLAITAIIGLVFGSQSLTVDSQTDSEATYKAQALLENARAVARQNFSAVSALACDDNISPPCNPSNTFYKSKLAVTQPDLLDPYTDLVTVTITYKTGNNLSQTVKLSTLVTDPQSAGNVCSSKLTGDWKSPKVYFSDRLGTLVPGNNSNGLGISEVKVYNHKLYLAAYGATNNDYTFYIFDLPANPAQPPVFDGGVDNAPTVTAGLNAVAVSGNYAYAANSYGANFGSCSVGSNCAQLQIINISIPSAPTVAKNFKIPGVTGSSGQAIGKSIFYSNGYVYIGLAKTAGGPEFNVIDVGGGGAPASPTNPIWKGGYSVGNAVNSIYVKGNYAYIATPNAENMTILDISNPSSLSRVGGSASLTAGNANGESVYADLSNNIYLGRAFGTNEFYMFNGANPGSLSVLGSQDVGSGSQTTINGLAIKSNLAFFLTNAQFQVWDITNSGSIKPWSSDGTTNTFLSLGSLVNGTASGSSALNCTGTYFYISLQTSGNNKDYLAIIGPNASAAPAFDYSLSASSPSLTVSQGSSVQNTITVNMIPGATPQAVNITFSNLQNHVAVSPAPGFCTPNGGSCSVVFTITAASNAQKKTNIITVNGVSPAQSTTFTLTVQ